MDDYTALSDDSLQDFIVSGNCQEKQEHWTHGRYYLENSF